MNRYTAILEDLITQNEKSTTLVKIYDQEGLDLLWKVCSSYGLDKDYIFNNWFDSVKYYFQHNGYIYFIPEGFSDTGKPILIYTPKNLSKCIKY